MRYLQPAACTFAAWREAMGKFGFGSHQATDGEENKSSRTMEAAIGLYIAGAEVGRADGDFDEKERSALSNHMMAIAANSKSKFVADAAFTCARWEEMREVYNQDKRSHRDHLGDLRAMMEKIEKEDKFRYIIAFVSTTRVVGDASGGGWFNSETFSEKERQVSAAMWSTLFDLSELDEAISWVRQYGK